ncbi:MAG: amidohydrolase family protein [Cyclobacteriaceae bacterium]
MKTILKYLKWLGLGLIILISLALLLLATSIPYSRISERAIDRTGSISSNYVVTSVNIVDIENDSILKLQNVYVTDGIIHSIEPDSLPIKPSFQSLRQFSGKYLMPGLVDMHAHVFDRTDLPQYLSYGITTVRNMMGFPMHLRWKNQLSNDELQGSRLITGSPTLNKGEGAGPFHKLLTDDLEARETANNYADMGYDFFKVYDGIDAQQLTAIQQVARSRNMKIAGHPPAIGLEGLVASDLVSIEHVEELLQFLDEDFSPESVGNLIAELHRSGKYVVISLSAYHRIYQTVLNGTAYYDRLDRSDVNPLLTFIGDKQLADYTSAGPKYTDYTKKKYQAMKDLTLKLQRGGVPLLFGTDVGPNLTAPGRTVLEEIELLQQAGLTNQEILLSATATAGECLEMPIGKLQIGHLADMIITSENPLDETTTLSEPLAIFQDNQQVVGEEIEALRRIGEDKQSFYATLGLFLEAVMRK